MDLIDDILDHPNPERVLEEIRAVLEKEQADRQKFREWLKPDIKAEFINGEIITHSPAKRRHNQAVKHIAVLLDLYVEKRSLGEVAIEKALVELERNDFEPDICFWRKEVSDTFNDDMLFYPVPDLVVEVTSKSTAGRDRGIKFGSYEEAGVGEYWIVDPVEKRVDQFVGQTNAKRKNSLSLIAELNATDQISSKILEGFTVPVRAFFEPGARGVALEMMR